MTLALSSVLHYWSARYGSIPVVGGKPVHSRSSGATWVDQQGVVQSAIVNTPRFPWATIDSEKRQVMALESARTNMNTRSVLSTGWTANSMTVTDNAAIAPDGTATACKLVPTVVGGWMFGPSIAGNSNGRTFKVSIWLRADVAGNAVVGLIQSSGAGAGPATTVAVTTEWQRYLVTFTGNVAVAAYGFYLDAQALTALYAWGADIQEAASWSAHIPTAGATATRAADAVYWDHLPAPQGFALYMRFIERGLIGINGSSLMIISDAAGNGPCAQIYCSGGLYHGFFSNAVGSRDQALAAGPSYGDTVELLLRVTGAGVTSIVQSINGAAVTASAASAALALPSAWSAQRIYHNSFPSGVSGLADYAETKMVKYGDVVAATDQGMMDELRAFELGPNGAVL